MVQNQLNPALYQSQLPYHHPTIDELAVAQQTMQLQAVAQAAAAAQQTQQSSSLITPISHMNTASTSVISTSPDVTSASSAVSKDSQPLPLLPTDTKITPLVVSGTASDISLAVNMPTN